MDFDKTAKIVHTVDNMDEEEIGFRYKKPLQTFKYFGGQGVLWILMKKYFFKNEIFLKIFLST